MKNKIFFLPASQIDNTGDVLINKVLLDELRRHGDLIVNDAGKPDWFLKEIGVNINETLSQITNKKFYEYLENQLSIDNECRYYLVIHPGHTSRFSFKSALYGDHGFFSTRFLRKIKKKGCHILRFGFSIGPFDIYNTIAEFFYATLYKVYAVRDTQSFKLGKSIFLQNLLQMPDLAWSFKNSSLANQEKQESYIAISFRSNNFGSVHSSQYLRPIIEELRKILPDNKKIKIVYQVKYDQEPAKEIYKSLLGSKNVELIDEKLDLQTAADLYKNADYIISNRLHVLLLGIVQQVFAFPLVIPGDNDKIINIFKDNELQHYILYLKDEADKNNGIIDDIIGNSILNKRKLQQIINKNDDDITTVILKSFI